MPEIYRAFVFVSVMAIPAFVIAQLATRSFIDRSEATLWRNCWFFTTAAVFLSGNFLVFTLLMVALSIYVHKATKAPYHLYFVLLMTGPVVGIIVGIPGVMPTLLELNPARVMVLVFLLPTAYRLARSPQPERHRSADILISLFLLLVIALSLRHGSPTHMLRIALVTIVDIGVPYFVFSRSLHSIGDVRRSLTALLFGVLPFALAGMFEFARGWRTYNAVIESWGVNLIQAYLFRDGLLRAAATAIEPIAFGFVCMVGVGVLLANMSEIRNKLYFWGAGGILAGGLAASLSRGPWLGTVVLLIVFAATTRRGFLNVVKLGAVAAVLCVPLAFSPVGERIYRLLPFVGSVEKSNEDYRSKLIDISAIIVARNPLFGSARYSEEPEMQELIQGQGIVDIVNSYIAVALEFGLVGVGLFAGFFLSIGYGLYRACFRTEGSEAILMRAMTATLASMLLTIGTVSSVATIPYIYWSFAGVCVAALRLGQTSTVKPKLSVLGYTG